MDRKHLVAKAQKLADKKKSDAEAEGKLVADAARMEEEGPRAAAALEQLIADLAHQEQVGMRDACSIEAWVHGADACCPAKQPLHTTCTNKCQLAMQVVSVQQHVQACHTCVMPTR